MRPVLRSGLGARGWSPQHGLGAGSGHKLRCRQPASPRGEACRDISMQWVDARRQEWLQCVFGCISSMELWC